MPGCFPATSSGRGTDLARSRSGPAGGGKRHHRGAGDAASCAAPSRWLPNAPADSRAGGGGGRSERGQGAGGQAYRQARACAEPYRQLRGRGMTPRRGLLSGACCRGRRELGRLWVPAGLHADCVRSRPVRRSGSLSRVFVEIIPDRPGQLLRQALQERFGDDSGTPASAMTCASASRSRGEGIGDRAGQHRDADPADRQRQLDVARP